VSEPERLEHAIEELLDARTDGATVCPSEAARRVDPDGWRDLMNPARAAAARMVENGLVDVVQHGEVVDPATARSPIRIRRRRRG
jgi:hypothetical protein